MPAIYEHQGIRFMYPENWSVMDEEYDAWPHSVTVQSPQTAFWSLHVYPPRQEVRPLVKEVVESIQASFPDQELEVLPATDEVADTETKGVDICFFYLDLLVEARIRTVKTPSATLIWHYQAESRELEEMEQVFRAIATSLLQNQVPVP
ncbi:MAG TPA: hypothetical protein VFB96_23810 [Pirellulaceae bacterium]|nr:hypothetical protein [Pirellulaceae bacterium]